MAGVQSQSQSQSQSPQMKAAMAFINSFDKLDAKGNLELRSQDCRHTILPTGLGFKEGMTNEEWLGHITGITAFVHRFPVTAVEAWEAGAGGGVDKQVTVHATSKAYFKDEFRDREGVGKDGCGYEGEYIFIFWFSEEGGREGGDSVVRIKRVLEMVDSERAKGVRDMMAGWNK